MDNNITRHGREVLNFLERQLAFFQPTTTVIHAIASKLDFAVLGWQERRFSGKSRDESHPFSDSRRPTSN